MTPVSMSCGKTDPEDSSSRVQPSAHISYLLVTLPLFRKLSGGLQKSDPVRREQNNSVYQDAFLQYTSCKLSVAAQLVNLARV